jgi:hypothetical protein
VINHQIITNIQKDEKELEKERRMQVVMGKSHDKSGIEDRSLKESMKINEKQIAASS